MKLFDGSRHRSQRIPVPSGMACVLTLCLALCACQKSPAPGGTNTPHPSPGLTPEGSPGGSSPSQTEGTGTPVAGTQAGDDDAGIGTPLPAPGLADVVSVSVSGNAESYEFAVGILSPDTGCELYADWWEVLTGDGQLVYRRILSHSHAGEQPFVRSGGPVAIAADRGVIVRAHLNPGGFGGQAYEGSVATGFKPAAYPADFASAVESLEPQPSGCAF